MKTIIKWFYNDQHIGYLFMSSATAIVLMSTINLAGWLTPLVLAGFIAFVVGLLLIGGLLAKAAEKIADGVKAVGEWARR